MTQLTKLSLIHLLIFHVAGLYVFLIDDSLMHMSVFNILFCGVVLFINEKERIKALPVYVTIFIGGIAVEVIGSKTGYLFGDYTYGATLGYQVMGVPLIMGVNWFCMVIASFWLAARFIKNPIVLYLSTAALATVADFLIEPIAIKHNYWTWGTVSVPLFNYLCWFIFAFFFAALYGNVVKKTNPIAISLYLIWFIFFGIVNLFAL